MNGILFLEPFGGLGNRMRVIVSGIHLSKKLNKKLKIVWNIGDDFNCRLNRLFEPNLFFEVCSDNEIGKTYSSYNSSKIKRIGIRTINKVKGLDLVIWEQDLRHTFYSSSFNVDSLHSYKNIYIRSCESFYGGNEWRSLQPISEIKLRIEKVMTFFAKKTVGVHIRRSDNLKSVKHSPLRVFIDLMETEIKIDEKVVFFVATDDPHTQEELVRLFTNRIVFYEKELSRSNEKGIQDALVDLLCLSNCSKIIGSYWSSFTEVASYINGASVVIAKQ